MYRSVFNIMFALLLFGACDDIVRDNVLDPKNPNSFRPQVVTVEAFVNTGHPSPYSGYLLAALDSLQTMFGARIVIAEHHRPVTGNTYNDNLVLDDSELLYDKYFTAVNEGNKGIPDVYINGIGERIQGASSVSSVLFRLQNVLQPLISENSSFTIEPDVSRSGNDIILKSTVARLGSDSAINFKLRAMLLEDIDGDSNKRVVRKIIYSNIVPQLSAGEVTSVYIGTVSENYQGKLTALFFLTSQNDTEVYQAIAESVQ